MTSGPIFDEIHQFMKSMNSLDLSKVFKNFSVGVERISYDMEQYRLAVQAAGEKFRKQQRRCLRGRVQYHIEWRIDPLKCPQCHNHSVLFSDVFVWCLLCNWRRERIGLKGKQ